MQPCTDQPRVQRPEADEEVDLKSALEHSPAVPDDQSTLQPHGEKLKRSPDAPEYNPNMELVDTSTDQLREHSLAEAVQRDHPLLDDQQGTPYHTADKAGGRGREAGLPHSGHGGL